jgi:predicted N-acetyltransferase YhbS
MPDLLVNLLKLPEVSASTTKLESGTKIRRAQPFEITHTLAFVRSQFSQSWADEISVGFANKPVSVFIATHERAIIGFAAYECTRRGFFGPMGVAQDFQKRGIGKCLLVSCLWGLREMGYVYGVIGGAGPIEFYQNAVGAIVISDSEPGIYADLLRS